MATGKRINCPHRQFATDVVPKEAPLVIMDFQKFVILKICNIDRNVLQILTILLAPPV